MSQFNLKEVGSIDFYSKSGDKLFEAKPLSVAPRLIYNEAEECYECSDCVGLNSETDLQRLDFYTADGNVYCMDCGVRREENK